MPGGGAECQGSWQRPGGRRKLGCPLCATACGTLFCRLPFKVFAVTSPYVVLRYSIHKSEIHLAVELSHCSRASPECSGLFPRMTAQLLAAELGNLIQDSKRKNTELRNAAEKSLQDLKSLPNTSETQLTTGKPPEIFNADSFC